MLRQFALDVPCKSQTRIKKLQRETRNELLRKWDSLQKLRGLEEIAVQGVNWRQNKRRSVREGWSGITAKLRTLCFLHSAEPVACLLTITLISYPRASSECWVQHLFSQKWIEFLTKSSIRRDKLESSQYLYWLRYHAGSRVHAVTQSSDIGMTFR